MGTILSRPLVVSKPTHIHSKSRLRKSSLPSLVSKPAEFSSRLARLSIRKTFRRHTFRRERSFHPEPNTLQRSNAVRIPPSQSSSPSPQSITPRGLRIRNGTPPPPRPTSIVPTVMLGMGSTTSPAATTKTVPSTSMTTRGTTIGSIFLSSRSRSDSYTNTNTNTNTDSTPTSYSTPGSIWWKSDRRIRRGPQRRLFQSPHLPADDDAQPPTLYMLDGEVIAMEPPPSLDNRLDCVDAVWPEPRRSRMSLVGGAGRRSRLVVVNRGRESVESGSFSLTGPANGRQSGSGLKVMNKKEKCGELRSQEKENGEWKGEMFKPRTGKTGSCNNDDEDDGDVAGSFGMPVTSKELLDEVEDARRMVDERMDWFWVDDGGILRYKYCGLPVKELS